MTTIDETDEHDMSNVVRVQFRKHPLSPEVAATAVAEAGMTISEILGDVDDERIWCALDDARVEPQFWPTTVPEAGSMLYVVGIPAGDDTRQLLLIAGTIAAAVFAPAVAGKLAAHYTALATDAGLLGAGIAGSSTFWSAAILGGSSLLLSSLVTPPVLEVTQ